MISVVKRLLLALTLGLALAVGTAMAPAVAAQSQSATQSAQVSSPTNKKPGPKCHWVKGHWEYTKGHKEWVPGHWEYKNGKKHWVKGHNKWVKGTKTWKKGYWKCPPCGPYHYNCMPPSAKPATVSKNKVSNANFALRSAPETPAGPDSTAVLAGALGVVLIGSGATSIFVNRRRLRRAED